jgi:hypothetical protein
VHNACKKGERVQCETCDKTFTTVANMRKHVRLNCKNVKPENDYVNANINTNADIKKRDIDADDKECILERLLLDNKKQIEELKEQIKFLSVGSVSVNNNNNNKTNNKTTNKGVINNNNIVLVAYGNEDMEKIDKDDILKCMKKGFYSPIDLIEAVHFNPKYPEYHNIYISNTRGSSAMIFDGNQWGLADKNELIDKLYEDNKNYIEENMEDYLISLSKSQKDSLNRWFDTNDDHKKVKEVKGKMRLLLYNKRSMVTNPKSNDYHDNENENILNDNLNTEISSSDKILDPVTETVIESNDSEIKNIDKKLNKKNSESNPTVKSTEKSTIKRTNKRSTKHSIN